MGSERWVTTILELSFKVAESHFKSGHVYLKCEAELPSKYLLSGHQIVNITKRPPVESISANTVQLAKIQGKYQIKVTFLARKTLTII